MITQLLLPEFDQEMANTRKTLERVPTEKFDYKPHEKSMSFRQLAGHLSDMPSWAKSTMETDFLKIDASFQPYSPKSTEEMLAKFDRDVAAARALIEKATDEDWARLWSMEYMGQKMVEMPKVAVMRSFVMNHMVHHRAQLGVYLRLNNIEVPGVYGPSADEMKSMGAQNS